MFQQSEYDEAPARSISLRRSLENLQPLVQKLLDHLQSTSLALATKEPWRRTASADTLPRARRLSRLILDHLKILSLRDLNAVYMGDGEIQLAQEEFDRRRDTPPLWLDSVFKHIEDQRDRLEDERLQCKSRLILMQDVALEIHVILWDAPSLITPASVLKLTTVLRYMLQDLQRLRQLLESATDCLQALPMVDTEVAQSKQSDSSWADAADVKRACDVAAYSWEESEDDWASSDNDANLVSPQADSGESLQSQCLSDHTMQLHRFPHSANVYCIFAGEQGSKMSNHGHYAPKHESEVGTHTKCCEVNLVAFEQ